MIIWLPNPADLKRPVYRSLADAVVQAVDEGKIKPGARLPTHRDLAYRLGISVQTVSRAYGELIHRGIIVGQVGRGSYVRTGPPDTRTPFLPESQYDKLVDCSILKPVMAEIHFKHMQKALARLADGIPASAVTSFRPSAALNDYREPAEEWLARCGLQPGAGSVLYTNGSTPAMTIALMSAAAPGDLIVTEEMGHHTLKPLCRYLGLRLEGLKIDREGIVPGGFAQVCARGGVKALYIMPSGLNPTAAMMGAKRRQAIAEIAEKHDVLIIENDAWGPLQPGRPAPLARIVPERTLYFTSFSKCIMPGLRTGYLVVPKRLEAAASNRHLVTNWMATPLLAEIAAGWIRDGTAETLLRWQIEALGHRNQLTQRALQGIDFRASPNGMHIWLPLPEPWSEEEFVKQARLAGVAVATGSSFHIGDHDYPPGVRICIGTASESALEDGLTTIAWLARSEPEPALLAI